MNAATAILRRSLSMGAVAGVVMLYLITVGIAFAFAEREIIAGTPATLGRLMIAAPPLVAGYAIAGRRSGTVARLTGGLVSGLVAGGILAASLLFANAVDVQDILIRVSKPLLKFVAMDQEPALGAILHVALGAALGLAGAGLRLASPRVRNPILAAAIGVVVGGMLERLVRPRLSELRLTDLAKFLWQGQGLTPAAAVLVAILSAAIVLGAWPGRARIGRMIAGADPTTQQTIRWASFALLLAALLALPQIAGSFVSQVLVLVGLYVLLGLGLNIVVGFAGLLDLGYVAFFAVGSYLTALLTSPLSSLGVAWPFWVALPVVVLGSAVTGLMIGAPVLRLRGDYLAIVTLGFGEIARILFLSDALKPWVGGTQGILGVPNIALPFVDIQLSGPQLIYYPLLLFCILAAFVATRLKYSRIGRAWSAMREDEDVAEATGVNTVNYKLLAFALGASVGCLGGAVFAARLQSVFPGSFSILVSITVLAIVILGGMGSIPGVVLGALALIGLPEALREFAEFKLLVYGGALVAMMLLRPEGFLPDVARRRELHEADELEEPPVAEPAATGG
jgi:branched-chain amino acid transport system permease protein